MKKKIFYAIFLGILVVQVISVLSVTLILHNLAKSHLSTQLLHLLNNLTPSQIEYFLSTQSHELPPQESQNQNLENAPATQPPESTLEQEFGEHEAKSAEFQTHFDNPMLPHAPLPYRLSIISLQGEVLYDNLADITHMDNHLQREEVRSLLSQLHAQPHATQDSLEKLKPIITQRLSPTMSEESIYVSHLVSLEGYDEPLIVRLCQKKRSFGAILLEVLPYAGALLLLSFGLSILLAFVLSKKIITPLENIDLSHPVRTNPYPELHVFMQKIAKQKKKIKKQLRTIKQRQSENEMIVQNMGEGFVLLDSQMLLRSCNHAAQSYLGIEDNPFNLWQKPSLRGLYESITQIIQTQELLYKNTLQSSLDSDFSESSQNFIPNNAQDCVFECEINGRFLQVIALPSWVKGKLKAIALILLDKSTQKCAQDLRREFSANVTHELKTPLSVILASSEMLKSGLVKKQDEGEFLHKIHSESKRLLVLIDKILRLSFFDENSVELEKSPLLLSEIFKRVSKNLSPVAEGKHIRILLETPSGEGFEGEGKIIGVGSLIEDMVYNLVENAIKYSTEHSRIWLFLTYENGCVALNVADEGIGIPLEEQERVFERFYCVDKSRSKKLGGSGLGLSIVKHIAKIHNAKLKLQSQLGKGTTIRVEFRE